jgi:GAF domain-containing protein
VSSVETRKGAFSNVLESLEGSTKTGVAFRKEAMELIHAFPGYDWCGVYRLEGEELVLDAYRGAPTDHDRIPVGRGVCGTAVKENENQVVDDVNKLDNYLSCSLETKSEIVVLIRSGSGEILGQIDLDGHQIAEFKDEDERFLATLAERMADRWS